MRIKQADGTYVQSVVQPFGIVQPATSKQSAPLFYLSDATDLIALAKRNGSLARLWAEEIDEAEYNSQGYKMLEQRTRRKELGDWFRKALVVRKDVNSEATGAQGGFLVPPQWRVGIDELIAECSFFHRHATLVPMTGVELNVPTVDPAAAASGGSPLFGGFTMYWQGINDYAAPTASNPLFEDAVIVACNLGGFGYVSNQLIDDGGEALGAYLETIVARATAFYVTKACFVGDGMEQPVGVVNSPGSAVVARTGAGALVAGDFSNMQKKLLPACYPHAKWCVSPGAYSQMSGLTGFFPIMTDEEGMVGWYRGFPVFVTEALPALGTKGDVVLLDPRLFALGERQEIEVAWAKDGPVGAFAANQSTLRAWWRGGGALTWRTTGTAANGETGVSPCVVLDT